MRCRFALKLQETEPTELKPVFSDGDVSYAYLQHNNIYIVALTRRNRCVAAHAFARPRSRMRSTHAEVGKQWYTHTCISSPPRPRSNVTSVFVFLERLVEILKEYFGTLEEEARAMRRAGPTRE